MPVLLSHGHIASFRPRGIRLATSMELLASQGFHVFPSQTKNYPLSSMLPILKGLTIAERKTIMGNAMHIPTVASFMFYCLANVVRLREESVPRPIVEEINEEESDVSEAAGSVEITHAEAGPAAGLSDSNLVAGSLPDSPLTAYSDA